MPETVFSRILSGELPCHKVFENEHVLAFLDIAPVAFGHTLVIPKEPARTLDELSEGAAAELGRVLPRLCRAIQQVTGTRAYNLLQNNEALAHQAVFHVHFHIIPKPNEASGLGVGWAPRELGSEAAQRLATELSALLSRQGG